MTPLVLLPGLMCDAQLFAPQIAAFSASRMVCAAPVGGPDDVAGIAANILEWAPRRFALAGLSMGGIVAMEIMRQAADRVERLALLDTNPLAEAEDVAQRRNGQIERVRAGRLAEVMRDEMKPHYLADGPDKRRILQICMDMAENLGADQFASQSRALQTRPDQCGTLRRITVPTLILCGAKDGLCPVSRHALMHDLIPGSRLEIVADAGHLPTLEQPRRTTELLAGWLAM